MSIKKTIFVIAALAAVLLTIRFLFGGLEDTWICDGGQWVKHGNPSASIPTEPCGDSMVITNFAECAQAVGVMMESYPRQCRTPDGRTFVEDIGNEIEKADLIRLEDPRPNQAIQSPLVISGEARGTWFFEASFPVRLVDADGNLLAHGIAQAQSDWMTENFVPFMARLTVPVPKTKSGTLFLEKDNPSGLPENDDALRVPVLFSDETMAVKAYFGTPRTGDAPNFDCGEVEAVERRVWKTEAVGRAALEELLRGPTPEELDAGFTTSINPGVEIQSLTIENGVARVDFSDELERAVGGSCRVAAIRSQITETLKQFPTVTGVTISIDGRTEDILQP